MMLAVVHGLQDVAAEELLHDFKERVARELFNCRKALGKDFAVASVGAEDRIVLVQVERHAHRGRLLAHRKVRGAGMIVDDALVLAGGLDEVEHRLKLAQHQHVAVDAGQLGGGEIAHLVLDGLLVGVDRDVLKMDRAGFAKRRGIDVQLL